MAGTIFEIGMCMKPAWRLLIVNFVLYATGLPGVHAGGRLELARAIVRGSLPPSSSPRFVNAIPKAQIGVEEGGWIAAFSKTPLKENVPSSTAVSSLMSAKKDILLFRVLDEPYKKGKLGPFSEDEGFYAYSLDPAIINEWPGKGIKYRPEAPHVAIALQNVERDNLKFPFRGYKRARLTPNTTIQEISFFKEVDVLPAEENVIFSVPLEKFRSILRSHRGAPSTIEDLLRSLRQLKDQ